MNNPILHTHLHRWSHAIINTLLSTPATKGVMGVRFKCGQGDGRDWGKSRRIESGTENQTWKMPSIIVHGCSGIILQLPVIVILSGEGPQGCSSNTRVGGRRLQPLSGILFQQEFVLRQIKVSMDRFLSTDIGTMNFGRLKTSNCLQRTGVNKLEITRWPTRTYTRNG